MIELNLLPEEYRKKKKKLELPEVPIIPLAAALVGGLLLFHFLLGGLILICKGRLSSLDETWRGLAPKKAEIDAIKLEIKTTAKKNSAIEKLIEKRLRWARLLNELGDTLSANIWLTGLVYKEPAGMASKSIAPAGGINARTLLISGSAEARGEEATRDIARFIKALKANGNFFKNFDDIELVSIKKGAIAGNDLMNFTLICRFKPEKAGE